MSNLTEKQLQKVVEEWSKTAKEPISITQYNGFDDMVVYGSETACYRLQYAWRFSADFTKVAYSENLKSWYFQKAKRIPSDYAAKFYTEICIPKSELELFTENAGIFDVTVETIDTELETDHPNMNVKLGFDHPSALYELGRSHMLTTQVLEAQAKQEPDPTPDQVFINGHYGRIVDRFEVTMIEHSMETHAYANLNGWSIGEVQNIDEMRPLTADEEMNSDLMAEIFQ